MARLLLLILIIASSATSNGQIVAAKIQAKIDSLKLSNVDTFFVYAFTCNGGLILLDTCAYEEPRYLFWKQYSNYFLQKFDYCKSYIPVELDTLNPLSFYFANKNQIIKEKILFPTYVEFKKGNKGTEISMTVDHACFYEMTFSYNGKKVFKSASNFDLTFIKFDNGKKNIYYNYNQHTKFKKLIDLITKLIPNCSHQ